MATNRSLSVLRLAAHSFRSASARPLSSPIRFLALSSSPAKLHSQSRFASTDAFDPKTHAPDERYGSVNLQKLLSKSILSEVAEDEAKTQIELAACYRLFELAGWNENIYNHLTAKVREDDATESFLLNPFGFKYSEVTASSLIKIAADGSIRNAGVTGDIFGINDAGFVIHSAIHRARPDLKSVMHCHAGVSCTKKGYLELAQTSHQVGRVAYHDYHGIVVDRGE